MPKRIVDGEGIWSSDKLASVDPEWVRAEYANLIPLALSNGSFECNVRRIWRDVYGFNRPSITEEKVSVILSSLEKAKLLFRFESGGKTWGYWVGIEKPGRLPSVERRGTHERKGAEVPEDELQCFLMDAVGVPPVSSRASARPNPRPKPTPNPEPNPGAEEFSLPDWIPAREWGDYAAMRMNIRKPIKTAKQAGYCVRVLDRLRLGGNDPREVLEQSIANGYQGLFAVKNQGGSSGKPTVAEQNRRNAAIALEMLEGRERARAEAVAGAGGDPAEGE